MYQKQLTNIVVEEPVELRQVVLVDSEDRKLGLAGIWEAHRGRGMLHRAISVLLYDGRGKVLLQRRSKQKPLWPLYWSNTVCTHPGDGEGYLECAVRRLKEEMGVEVVKEGLYELYRFEYQATYNSELAEHELDTVVMGEYRGEVKPNPDEVASYKWVKWGELVEDIGENPKSYTPWFQLMLREPQIVKAVSR
jgi:isopentenyl-diphosphate delta-isomerase